MDEAEKAFIRAAPDILRMVQEIFDKDSGDWATRQRGACSALRALIAYASDRPELRDNLGPLHTLYLALDDLTSGAPHPLLVNYNTKHGARPLTLSELTLHAWGIALTETLMDSGFDEGVATGKVADALAAAGAVGSRSKRPVTPSMVRGWRTIASSGDNANLKRLADQLLEEIRATCEKAEAEWPLRRSEAEAVVWHYAQSDNVVMLTNSGRAAK